MGYRIEQYLVSKPPPSGIYSITICEGIGPLFQQSPLFSIMLLVYVSHQPISYSFSTVLERMLLSTTYLLNETRWKPSCSIQMLNVVVNNELCRKALYV